MVTKQEQRIYRIPAWIKRVEQDLSKNTNYEGIFWNPPVNLKHSWKHNINPKLQKNKLRVKNEGGLKIYECHIGICTPEPRVATYKEFEVEVVPRIAKLGYNAVQIMAIMEHPYYASFGYQVSSFFAISSRFGTPEEFCALVDTCHSQGLMVFLDVVHAHAASNVEDGLNSFDGTDSHFFHSLPKGMHPAWGSRLFDYAKFETLRFLLANLKYFKDEYNFDGFRFDGVTSMLYNHHGLGTAFTNYDDYFGPSVDEDSVVYFCLANKMLNLVDPLIINIAEDVSGMPGICRLVEDGGLGFDYRLSMAVPDMWIKLIKEYKDEEWNMGNIVHTLTNRRYLEKTIGYAESHDQALVGDKTIAFRLMDKEMYTHMTKLVKSDIIDRGLALHKMIRLICHALGGEGYLNFMGNEFGHPEWLDFPREGNSNSFHYARRQYNLCGDSLLKYHYLSDFDLAMQHLEESYQYMNSNINCYVSWKHEDDKLICFEKGPLVFIFNFHPLKSFESYKVPLNISSKLRIVLDTDDKRFGGFSRIDHQASIFFPVKEDYCFRTHYIQVYIPSRSALVLAPEDNSKFPLFNLTKLLSN